MEISEVLFVGFSSRVVALGRETGEVVWSWKCPKGSGYVVLLVDGDKLFVSVGGYTYCLDPLTGGQIWFNELKGFGTGVPSLATVNGAITALQAIAADEESRRSSDSAATGAATHT
jgi:outer membrane protein assembly factor BamB